MLNRCLNEIKFNSTCCSPIIGKSMLRSADILWFLYNCSSSKFLPRDYSFHNWNYIQYSAFFPLPLLILKTASIAAFRQRKLIKNLFPPRKIGQNLIKFN